MSEQFVSFTSNNNMLSAIIHSPDSNRQTTGILILVGGPQYRVGSHRQFVKLSRAFAAEGISSMRLDTSGMGDSSGTAVPFYQRATDIEQAINQFFKACPYLNQLMLWGLCDAASAILIKLNKPDPRISGVILLNPWVRQAQSHAQTLLKHYYLKRLISRQFWQKLFKGSLKLTDSLTSLSQTLSASRSKNHANNQIDTSMSRLTEHTYVSAMLQGWQNFNGMALVITSGHDLTAQEFLELCASASQWKQCLGQAQRLHLPEANHTFSSEKWRQQVEQCCIAFIKQP